MCVFPPTPHNEVSISFNTLLVYLIRYVRQFDSGEIPVEGCKVQKDDIFLLC